MPPGPRLAVTIAVEALVIGFFALLGVIGWQVLDVLATDTLVSLPEVPVSMVQSVVPISAALIIVAELLTLPEALAWGGAGGGPRPPPTAPRPKARRGKRRTERLSAPRRTKTTTSRGVPSVEMLLLFGCVLGLVLLNVPIAVALGVVAIAAIWLVQGTAALPNLPIVVYNAATNFPLLAIPLFILAGAIMNASGISSRLIAFATALLGFIRGGLAMVSIGASLFFAEISGSAVADVAALGSITIPAMKKKGYPPALAAAVMSSAATLAVIIPPSIPMILYAVMAEASVVQLFVAGIVPGIIGGLGLMAMAYWFAHRYDLPIEQEFKWSEVRRTAREALWAFTLPMIILGGIFGGVVTATEGAALAVVAALFIGLVVYRELDLAHLRAAVIEGGSQTAVVMLLVATSALLGVYLTEVQAPQKLAHAVTELTSNKWAILALLNLLFLLLGMFLHSAAAIILVVPVVMPLVKAAGIDPVHFGLIVTINLGIGQQTPPVASVLMVACSIAKESVWAVTKTNVWFVAVLLAVLLMVTYVPITGLGLVELFYR
jgi:tripartite ATP-independent transporter DctM subunit